MGSQRPYPPSFLDRFMRSIERLPLPYWLTYLLLFLLQSALSFLSAWADGWQPGFSISKILLVFPLWLWAPLTIMTWLNKASEAALASFSPLLEAPEGELERLRYEFTTLPNRGVMLNLGFWILVYILFFFLFAGTLPAQLGYGPVVFVTLTLESLVSFAIGSAIYYHSLHQLGLVARTVQRVSHFDLFRLAPVYAFSRLTARTGIAWMLMASLTLLLFPFNRANVLMLSFLVLQVILALAAFVLPLRSVNRKLVVEKRRLLSGVDQHIGLLLARLHGRINEGDIGEAESLSNTLMGLNSGRERVAGISTWPWSSGLLTGFLSAIVLPVVLLLIQLAIEKWLVK